MFRGCCRGFNNCVHGIYLLSRRVCDTEADVPRVLESSLWMSVWMEPFATNTERDAAANRSLRECIVPSFLILLDLTPEHCSNQTPVQTHTTKGGQEGRPFGCQEVGAVVVGHALDLLLAASGRLLRVSAEHEIPFLPSHV